MANRASKTEPTFDSLVGEFRALVDSMEDVFSAAAGESGEKLTELKGKAGANLRKAKETLGDMERSAVAKARKIASEVASLEFGDFRRAFWQLGDELREVLILVGASGLSYQDAARVCGCRKGTIMRRMLRVRRELLRILEDGLLADKRRAVPWPAGYIGNLLDGRRASFHQSQRGMRGG